MFGLIKAHIDLTTTLSLIEVWYRRTQSCYWLNFDQTLKVGFWDYLAEVTIAICPTSINYEPN